MEKKLIKIIEKYQYVVPKHVLKESILYILSERYELIDLENIKGINLTELKRDVEELRDMPLSEVFDILTDKTDTGSFYTPNSIAELVKMIAFSMKPNIKTVYDNSIGTGGLIMPLVNTKPDIKVYGRDVNYNSIESLKGYLDILKIEHELEHSSTIEETRIMSKADIAIINPPYGVKYNKKNVDDDYFEYLPKANDSTLLFIQDALKHSDRVIAVIPLGILFQNGAVGKWRKYVVERNWVDTVIQLPEKLFKNTSIPVAIMILDKTREQNSSVIDRKSA